VTLADTAPADPRAAIFSAFVTPIKSFVSSVTVSADPWAFWKRGFWTYGHWARRVGDSIPVAVKMHNMGVAVPEDQLAAARNRLLTFRGARSKAVFGFVAGFSEPFFLKTVERVAKLGQESSKIA
jgi:hypothetical protein